MDRFYSLLNILIDKTPGQESDLYIPIIILSALLIVSALIFSKIYKRKKKTDFAFKRLFKNVSRTMSLMGISFLILMLIRYENIPYFAMRLWIVLSFILLLFLTYKYINTYLKIYPVEKLNAQPREKKNEKTYSASKKR